jgi:cobalt-zinc-cadmium efflux system membrane fusion protein
MKTSIYVTLLTVLLFIACAKDNSTAEEQAKVPEDEHIQLTQAQFKNGDYKLANPEMQTFYNGFRVTGMVDVPPENRASVNSFFSGFVSKTHLLIGDVVQKGDLLIKLQNPEFIQMQQQFAQDMNQLEFLESEFQRKQNLLEDKVISQKVFQQTKSDYKSMQAKVQGQRKTLELMNVNINQVMKGNFSETISIYAPISGKVSKLNISQGTFVEQNTMIMELLDTDHIHLELNVFEKDIMKIKVGDTLDFKVPELDNQTFKAYVKLIGAEIGQNRSVRVHAHPVDEEQSFAVGVFVEAEFKTDAQQHLSLPQTAFAQKEDHWVILKLTKQTDSTYIFDRIRVKDSKEQNGRRAILPENKVSTGDRFLTNGVFDLISSSGGHDH